MTENKDPENKQNTEEQQVTKESETYVTFVQDPFGYSTVEVIEAQRTDEELDLHDEAIESETGELGDEGEKEDAEDLEITPVNETEFSALAAALAAEDRRSLEELEKVAREASEAVAAADAEARAAEEQAIAEAKALEESDPEAESEADAAMREAMPAVSDSGEMDVAELQSCIEALLFMSEKPVSLEKLYDWLCPSEEEGGEKPSFALFQEAMTRLRERYQQTCHGFEVAEIAGGYQLRTKPGRAALARKLAKVQVQRLSSGALETLAIVAYKQPTLKEDIDKVRGVDSSYFIRHLLDRKLIEITGRSEMVGRPLLYSTTNEFLELFALKDLTALPPLAEIERMIPASQSANPEEEDPRLREMRRLVGEMKADTSTRLQYDPREDEKILHDIRERVGSIATSTPYLEEQKALEKQAAELAKQQLAQPELSAQPVPAAPQTTVEQPSLAPA